HARLDANVGGNQSFLESFVNLVNLRAAGECRLDSSEKILASLAEPEPDSNWRSRRRFDNGRRRFFNRDDSYWLRGFRSSFGNFRLRRGRAYFGGLDMLDGRMSRRTSFAQTPLNQDANKNEGRTGARG